MHIAHIPNGSQGTRREPQTKKAVFRAHGVPPRQMHPMALHSGRQLSPQLGTAGGAGCGLPSGSLPAACTAALWTGMYNSSPSSTD